MEVGNRIRINKSDNEQDQYISAGERGTIIGISHDVDYHIMLEIRFDSGEVVVMDNTTFRFDVYRGKNAYS
jgi:hypothetical protein